MKQKLILSFVLAYFLAGNAQKQPNILVIWGDDVGQSNISAYTNGLMGYQTPNIDRVAKEGMIFTEHVVAIEGGSSVSIMSVNGSCPLAGVSIDDSPTRMIKAIARMAAALSYVRFIARFAPAVRCRPALRRATRRASRSVRASRRARACRARPSRRARSR